MADGSAMKPQLAAIKPGAKLDPALTALVQRMKAVAQDDPNHQGQGYIRIQPKTMPPTETCACGCNCC